MGNRAVLASPTTPGNHARLSASSPNRTGCEFLPVPLLLTEEAAASLLAPPGSGSTSAASGPSVPGDRQPAPGTLGTQCSLHMGRFAATVQDAARARWPELTCPRC